MLYPSHLGVDVVQHLGALLQPKHHVPLYQRELDAGGELLELLELGVRLGQQRLLVLLPAQRQKRPFPVALGQHLLRNVRLLVCQDGDAPLVLV
jgi:hypothetical protein